MVRREFGEFMGECTREGVGAAPGTRLPWLGGRDGCSRGSVRGRGRGSWYSSLGGSSRGGAPGTHLPICHLEEGCILSRSYVIAVSIHRSVLDVIIEVGPD